MRKIFLFLTPVLIGASPPPSPDARLRAIVQPVSQAQLRHTIETLVSFGTRHTLSSQTDPKRGIGAALNWAEAEFNRYSAACGNCLTVARTSDTFSGDRLPSPTKITDVFAIQRGTERPNDVVIIQGHIDSRVSDPMDATKDAPGANDDGSGTAAVLEAARVLSKHKFPGTIVYATLMGEEQGLYGGKVLAAYAKAHGTERYAIAGESDFGADRIWRFSSQLMKTDPAAYAQLTAALAPLGITKNDQGDADGTDVGPTIKAGAPWVSLGQDGTRYFDYHHTPDDTLDKIDPAQLRQNVAAWTTMLAVLSGGIEPGPKQPKRR